MRRVVKPVVSAATALAIALPAAWALVTPEKVLSLKASQILPSSNGTYLAYTSNSLAHPNRFNVYAYRYADGHKQRINAAGTRGFSGNFDPGTDTLIYEQDRTDRVDIYTYNLDTNAKAVRGARHWPLELRSRISTSFISFLRYFKASGRWWVQLRLFDRVTGHFRKLMTQRATGSHWINNGTVGDRFASWNVCSGRPLNVRGCDLRVRRPSTSSEKIPTNNAGRSTQLRSTKPMIWWSSRGLDSAAAASPSTKCRSRISGQRPQGLHPCRGGPISISQRRSR